MVPQWQIFHMKVQIMLEKIEEDSIEGLQGVLGISDSHRKILYGTNYWEPGLVSGKTNTN